MKLVDEDLDLIEVDRLEGHTDRVWSLAWKPGTGVDGVPAVLASCSGDKTARVWEETSIGGSFQCKAVLDFHTKTVRSCAWSPDGNLLATASFDVIVAIWEEDEDGFSCVSTLTTHESETKSVSWNASGSIIAICSRDKTVSLWEVKPQNEFECITLLPGHSQDVKMVQWHPSLDILFSCSYDNSIKIWTEVMDTDEDWDCVQTLDQSNGGHTSTVWAISFNMSGDRMVSCSDDLTIKIWSCDVSRMHSGEGFAPWKFLCTLSGYHSRTIFSVHWSSSGIICSAAADDSICLFIEDEDGLDLKDESKYKLVLKKEKAHEMDVNAVRWSSTDTSRLASASDDGTIKIWKLCSREKRSDDVHG